jgi:hypothetical protein
MEMKYGNEIFIINEIVKYFMLLNGTIQDLCEGKYELDEVEYDLSIGKKILK